MKPLSLQEVKEQGFIEKPYRPWEIEKPFTVQLFSNKWLDLFQQRGKSLVYLGTVISTQS